MLASDPMPHTLPVLYSFRRCPYAMRARLALLSAGEKVALREVVLRAKPAAFLAASPSGTVPCLVTDQGVIDESLDIMRWALARRDPQGMIGAQGATSADWITRCDGPFKSALDRTKYESRYPECDADAQRALAATFLTDLDRQIGAGEWIFDRQSLTDLAIAPFVRQFAAIDAAWFAAQPWPSLQAWLARFCAAPAFERIMQKYAPWEPEADVVIFPPQA